MKNVVLLLVFLGILVSPVWGDSVKGGVDFHSLVTDHYSFSPSKLTKEERESRSKILDSFWGKVSSDRETFLPKLREELGKTGNPPFFYYNGSKLLLSISNDTADKKIVVAAIAKSDLSDVLSEDYVRTVMKLGAEGIDTSIAAFKVLDYPNFRVFVPAHSLTLEQSYSLVFMLYQLREDMIVEKTINRLQGEKNPTAVKSLLRVLWYAATPAADETIAKFAKDTTTSDDVRKFAVELQNDTEQIAGLPLFEIEKLRKQLAFSKAIRKAAPVLSAHKKGEPMSKEEIELMKLFLRALFDSDEDILTDIAKNRDGTVPKEISDYAEGLLKGDKSLSHATPVGPPEDNITDLKNLRQTVLSALNDEVLYDFNAIAALIRWHQAKRAGQKAGQANAQPDVGADR